MLKTYKNSYSGIETQSDLKHLVLSRRYGERVKIGDAWITIERKDNQAIKILIDAPESVIVVREEVMSNEY